VRDDDDFSDVSDVGSQGSVDDVYSTGYKQLSGFTLVKDFFPDENKFIHTVKLLQRNVSYEVFSKQRFRLKKMLTKLRKDKANTLQNKSNG